MGQIRIGEARYASANTFERVFKGDYPINIRLSYINSLISDACHGIDYIDSNKDLSVLNHKQYNCMIMSILQSRFSMQLVKSGKVPISKYQYELALNSVCYYDKELEILEIYNLKDKERHKFFISLLNKKKIINIVKLIQSKKIKLQLFEVKHLIYLAVELNNYSIAVQLQKHYQHLLDQLDPNFTDQLDSIIVAHKLCK